MSEPSTEERSELESLIGPVQGPDNPSGGYTGATLPDRRRAYQAYEHAVNDNSDRLSVRFATGRGPDLSAVAALCDGVDWIVMWEGLLQSIEPTMSALAADVVSRDLFGSDPSLNVDALAHLLDSSTPAGSEPELLSLAAPANAMRAAYMAHAALRFICDHEFFHAFHGHVLLVDDLFDRSVIPRRARLAQPLEPRIRMAPEMEADRSALFSQFLDLAAGDGPGDPVIKAMTPAGRIHQATVAVCIVMALLAKGDEEPAPSERDATHPGIEACLFTLIEPTFVRALQMAGFGMESVVGLHDRVLQSLAALSDAHDLFAVFERATDERLREHHQVENRRLEMAYSLYVSKRLRRHSFYGAAVAASTMVCNPSGLNV